jgi:hypothetical protein
VKGKFLTRLREEDGSIVLLLAAIEERAALIESAPDVYFFTDHYRTGPPSWPGWSRRGPSTSRAC